MAWPKGKPRRIPSVLQQPTDPLAERKSAQRSIILHRLRREPVPRDLRWADDLRLMRVVWDVQQARKAGGGDDLERLVDVELARR